MDLGTVKVTKVIFFLLGNCQAVLHYDYTCRAIVGTAQRENSSQTNGRGDEKRSSELAPKDVHNNMAK